MAQIQTSGRQLTVSSTAPTPETWLPATDLDAQGDLVEWLIERTMAPYQVVAPFQIYGLTRAGEIVEGPLYGQNDIISDPSDAFAVTAVRVMSHIPGVIAYWIVPVQIVGAPSIKVRTVRVRDDR